MRAVATCFSVAGFDTAYFFSSASFSTAGFIGRAHLSRGVLAKSNGELVEKVVRIAREFGREIANPDEAREILSLPKRK